MGIRLAGKRESKMVHAQFAQFTSADARRGWSRTVTRELAEKQTADRRQPIQVFKERTRRELERGENVAQCAAKNYKILGNVFL